MKRNAAMTLVAGALIGAGGLHQIEAFAAGATAPERIQLMSYGELQKTRDGRGPFSLKDKDHAERVIAATEAHLGKTQMALDYDHQLVFAVGRDGKGTAPASGWVTSLEADDAGIWANVKWTPKAAGLIAGGEYRYISPVFRFDPKTRDVTMILNAAIVNQPALDLEALTASLSSFDTQETEDMDFKAIAAALGLPEDADEATIVAAIAARNANDTAIAAALGAEEGADLVAAATSLGEAANSEPDPTQFVPVAAVEELTAQVASLSAQVAEHQDGEIVAAVDAAISAGKLPPALKAWAVGMAKSDRAKFDAYVDAAPVLVATTTTTTTTKQLVGTGDVLTDDEKLVCAQMGLSEEGFIAARKAEAA